MTIDTSEEQEFEKLFLNYGIDIDLKLSLKTLGFENITKYTISGNLKLEPELIKRVCLDREYKITIEFNEIVMHKLFEKSNENELLIKYSTEPEKSVQLEETTLRYIATFRTSRDKNDQNVFHFQYRLKNGTYLGPWKNSTMPFVLIKEI